MLGLDDPKNPESLGNEGLHSVTGYVVAIQT